MPVILNTAAGITTAVFSHMKSGRDLGGNQLSIIQTILPRRTAISFAQTSAPKKEDNLQVLNLFSPAAFATSGNIWKILFFIQKLSYQGVAINSPNHLSF